MGQAKGGQLTLATPFQPLTQMTLPMRRPALGRSRDWQHPGICAGCGKFSLQTGRVFPAGVSATGARRLRVPKTRLCRACLPEYDIGPKWSPQQRMTPTLAVQMLGFGCPRAYQLRVEHPGQPSSPGNAFGTAYHLGRQLCEQKSLNNVGFFRTRWGLSNILAKFTDVKFFRHGVATQNDWEIPAMRHYLDQVFRVLWQRNQLVSVNSFGEALARNGTELIWWDAEMRLPVINFNWLLSGSGLVMPEGEKWRLNGAIDLIILTKKGGRYSVRIIDHKIAGVDIHEELDHRDCQTQLSLYACFAMQAFSGLGVGPEDISLWVHRLTLNPMRLEKVAIPFNREVWLATLGHLKNAVETYQDYQRTGFPARPSEWLCQGCDFALTRHLCPESLAIPGTWNLGVPYVPVPPRQPSSAKPHTGPGKCPFCRAPMKTGKWRPVCSNPVYDDCPREDR